VLDYPDELAIIDHEKCSTAAAFITMLTSIAAKDKSIKDSFAIGELPD
jgi:hypothetical protein